MKQKKMINAALILGLAMIFTACSGADCSCDEIVKNDGKYYRSGAYKEGNRVSFGELFSGTCETLDEKGEALEYGEYENGIILKHKLWTEFNGQYMKRKDMSYRNNKADIGWSRAISGDKKMDLRYVSKFTEYDKGDIKTEWKIEVEKDEIMVKFLWANFEMDFSNPYKECNTYCDNMLDVPLGEPLAQFIYCMKDKDLVGFEFWGTLPENLEKKSNDVIDSQEEKVSNETVEKQESRIENNHEKEVEEEYIEYYTVNDPDGYSNLRKTPGGEILMRINEGELFEVLGEEDKHKKVKLSDGTVGYIHVSRVVKN